MRRDRWDELILRIQRGLDRFTCRLRGAKPAPQPDRRFLIIQIDGLSHRCLEEALAKRRMPFVRRLLQRGVVKETPFFCSLPSSTAAFQAGLFYGGNPDVPAWKFYDKAAEQVIHFPMPGAAAYVEARESQGRPGILAGGSCYGAVFSGDAETSIAGFSRLYQPHFGLNWQTLWFLLPNLVVLWVFCKILLLTVTELSLGLVRIVGDWGRGLRQRLTLAQLCYHVFFHVIWRELLTLGVSADIYRGTPAIFVNYLSYDVFAHKYGPSSKIALRSLKAIDASIRQIYRVAKRVPEYNYDIFILSDHGMAAATPFEEISSQPLASVVLGALTAKPVNQLDQSRLPAQSIALVQEDAEAVAQLDWLAHLHGVSPFLPIWLARWWEARLLRQESYWLQRLQPELDLPRLLDQIKIVPAGPLVLVYFTHRQGKVGLAEIEASYPGALSRLSQQPGIGMILARDTSGPVCYWQGEKFSLDPNRVPNNCPFRNLTYRPLLIRAIAELIEMPSAGDLIIYGNGTGTGTISYLGERGSHAGFSPDELFAFVIYPKNIDFPFERVVRPADLYQFFRRYQTADEVDQADRRTA